MGQLKLAIKITVTTISILLLNACADLSGKHVGDFVCINCDTTNKSASILVPAIGECNDVVSKLNVDEAASRIKSKFNFMTTEEMRSSPNGNLLLSSTDYGWSATHGTHYMMKQAISQGRGGFVQAEISKKGTGSIIKIKTAVHVQKDDNLTVAKKSANDLAVEFRKRIIATLGK